MERAARAAVRAARVAPPREARVATHMDTAVERVERVAVREERDLREVTHMDTAAVRAAREAKSPVVIR